MATYVAYPGSIEEPEELASTCPIECASCGAEYDEEEDSHSFDTINGEDFCVDRRDGKPSCYEVACTAAYRKELAEALTETLNNALDEVAHYERLYPKAMLDDCIDHPATIIEDLIARLKAFAEGRDSGWRNGLMLSDDEAWTMRMDLERKVSNQHHRLEWSMGLNPLNPIDKPWPWQTGRDATQLATLGAQLLRLKHFQGRTEKGES